MGRGRQVTVAARACKCPGTSPEICLDDAETVTQWAVDPPPYTVAPRDRDLDSAISVVRGDMEPAEAYTESTGNAPPHAGGALLGRRTSTVKRLRDAGFGVVHTPGRLPGSMHASVVYPADDPVHTQVHNWPVDVQKKFDICFI